MFYDNENCFWKYNQNWYLCYTFNIWSNFQFTSSKYLTFFEQSWGKNLFLPLKVIAINSENYIVLSINIPNNYELLISKPWFHIILHSTLNVTLRAVHEIDFSLNCFVNVDFIKDVYDDWEFWPFFLQCLFVLFFPFNLRFFENHLLHVSNLGRILLWKAA